jgi:aldehyde:ferredoxin oxidoreductase
VLCIGPAGEHQAMIANVMNDMHRAAGRTGPEIGSYHLACAAA